MKDSKNQKNKCQHKFCKKCEKTKPLDQFYKIAKNYSTDCKECECKGRKMRAKQKKDAEIAQIMENFCPETFKIKGQVLRSTEKIALEKLGYKYCPSCKSAKIKEDFYGGQHYCIDCCNKKKKAWEEENPEYRSNYRKNNKEKQSATHRDWFLRNKEKKNKQNREWYYKNKERHIKNGTKNAKKRLDRDPSARLAKNIRERMRNTIFNGCKSASTLELLGCSFDDCRKHIEALFQEGMSWENYGFDGWHIDHIRPCASFDLTDPKQQAECFHYTNLQPLWAIDNIKKGDFFED